MGLVGTVCGVTVVMSTNVSGNVVGSNSTAVGVVIAWLESELELELARLRCRSSYVIFAYTSFIDNAYIEGDLLNIKAYLRSANMYVFRCIISNISRVCLNPPYRRDVRRFSSNPAFSFHSETLSLSLIE